MYTRSRSLSLACVSVGLLASCVTDDEPVGEELLARGSEGIVQPVAMHPALDDRGNPIPGTLVFETSEGRLDITHLVPDRPREFGSQEEFHEFVVKDLNGLIVEHEDGTRSTTIEYTASTTLRYDPRLDDLVTVEDPVDEIVGGPDGYVVIAGEQVCASRTAECAAKASPVDSGHRFVPAVVYGSSGPLGILGATWVVSASFVRWVGAATTQTSGTAGLRWTPCAPHWCYSWTGSNLLTAAYGGYLFPSNVSGAVAANNTLLVTTGKVDYGVPAPFHHLNSTCATHLGVSGPDVVFLQSGSLAGLPFNNC
ncbi:MAG: hypothetical protein WKG01_31945 [Kofleriaceae bacterium]